MSSEDKFLIPIFRSSSTWTLEIPLEYRALYDSEDYMVDDILSQFLNSPKWTEDDGRDYVIRVTRCSCEDCSREYRERIGSRPQI